MAKSKRQRTLATIADYQRTFTTDHGKRVFASICKECRVFTSTFDKDPHTAAFNEGTRAVALKIMDRLQTNLHDLEKQLKERKEYDEELWRDT